MLSSLDVVVVVVFLATVCLTVVLPVVFCWSQVCDALRRAPLVEEPSRVYYRC